MSGRHLFQTIALAVFFGLLAGFTHYALSRGY